ncbi:hypothetical protein Cni_G02447 [Canna indica]|uniref:MULE transposase domain-containing protein n=1 Tax=Canna indica TaxID=4628 RepID=A0AAQ3JS46_9LILI|nr:hypothetical protein Cni_G02447 [Canna indica]
MGNGSNIRQYGVLWRYAAEIKRQDPETTVRIKIGTVGEEKGLVDAVETLMPHCEHRFCAMHLYNNFKQAHKGLALKDMLWRAARATRILEFEAVMRELRDRDKAAFSCLAKRPAVHWSISYFGTHSKCDVLLNNMCDSFNAMILSARRLPILDMV